MGDANVCQICLDDMSLWNARPTDTLCSGPGWQHKFHLGCVNAWIREKMRQGETELRCPTCRRLIPPQTLYDLPLEQWPEIMVRVNGVNVLVFVLTGEMIQMLSVMRNTLAVMREAGASGLGRAQLDSLNTLDRAQNSAGALARISSLYLLLSVLFTMYVAFRTQTSRIRMRGGGTTLCMSMDGKEECAEIPDDMVDLIVNIVMRIKKGLPDLEKSLKKKNRNTPRGTTRRASPQKRKNTLRLNRRLLAI